MDYCLVAKVGPHTIARGVSELPSNRQSNEKGGNESNTDIRLTPDIPCVNCSSLIRCKVKERIIANYKVTLHYTLTPIGKFALTKLY